MLLFFFIFLLQNLILFGVIFYFSSIHFNHQAQLSETFLLSLIIIFYINQEKEEKFKKSLRHHHIEKI